MSSGLAAPFRLDDVDSIVVLPLAFGGVAPNRRKASWNGGEPYSLPFDVEEALVWSSPPVHFAGRPVVSPYGSWSPTFSRFGRFISGRHEAAHVAILTEQAFEAGVEITKSLLSDDGRRGSPGVGEWAPAFITINGVTTLGLHIVCLDDATDARCEQLLRHQAGLLTRVAFSRSRQEDATVVVRGELVTGVWNPLRLVGDEETLVHGLTHHTSAQTNLAAHPNLAERLRSNDTSTGGA